MNHSKSLIVTLSTKDDLTKITEDTKYLAIDIDNPDYKLISYLRKNGHDYKYTSYTNGCVGYNFVSFSEFSYAEKIIDSIFANIPNRIDRISLAKYIYISLAKRISYNINSDKEKNELYNLPLLTIINNLWGSLALGDTSSYEASKIYYYLLRRLGFKATLETNDKETSVKIIINNQILLTNIYNDIPYIWTNMQTKYFANYNDDESIDKKIKYLKTKYTDYYLDKTLKNIDYTNEDCVWQILNRTKDILKIDYLKPSCLCTIYKYIFDKYCPHYDIRINNLYLNTATKKHFILISYNGIHYSYNYKHKKFIPVLNSDLVSNINIGKIGLYSNELIPNINNC